MDIPRKRRKCWVESPPPATYYKPAGVPLRELEEVCLSLEEFEALRLKDLEGLEQVQCARRMGVARTTFQRILYAARAKIAEALVEGKAISIEGGRYVLHTECRYRCDVCGHEFERFRDIDQGAMMACPGCGRGTASMVCSSKGPGQGRRRGFRGGYCRGDGGAALNDGLESSKTGRKLEDDPEKIPEDNPEKIPEKNKE